jgi:DNA-binding CsgD family transcriptional regulator
VRALEAEVAGAGGAAPARNRHAEWPAGLTDREVEVLRLASRGLTREQIAKSLIVSESTVRHHLEHIYRKAGVSTRVRRSTAQRLRRWPRPTERISRCKRGTA